MKIANTYLFLFFVTISFAQEDLYYEDFDVDTTLGGSGRSLQKTTIRNLMFATSQNKYCLLVLPICSCFVWA